MLTWVQSILANAFATAPQGLLVSGTYSPPLVALSIAVAVLSACSALQIVTRIDGERSLWIRVVGLSTGSLALGTGVWAMHFIGMLSFRLCAPVAYDPLATLGSMAPSLAASFVALSILTRPNIRTTHVTIGGVLMGGGIGAMHYSGMAAMRMAPLLRYDPAMFAVSIVVAILLAMLAIWVRHGIREFRPGLGGTFATLAGGTIMGVAVSAMHYTGMAAARFVGSGSPPGLSAPSRFDSTFLSLAISVATVVIASLAMGMNLLVRDRTLLAKLRKSEARLRTMSDVAIDGIVLIDGDATIRELNPAAERIFACRAGDVVGKPATLLMPMACAAMHRSLDFPAELPIRQIAGGVILEIESRRLDGSPFPSRLAIGKTEALEQGLCVIFISDMTEEKRTADALRLSELKFRSLIGNLPGIAYRLSTVGEHTIEFLSAGVAAVTGYPPGEFTGREGVLRWRSITHRDDRERADRERIMAMNEGRRFEFEYRIRHRSGEWRWVWEAASAIRGADGKPAWIDGMIFDITERRRMEEALREAKSGAERAAAAKSAFVANMSHEIRTPLNAVLGFAQVGLKRFSGQPVEPTFRRILDSGELLLGIVNDVLDFSKIEAGKVELESRPFDPAEIVDRCVSLIARQVYGKGLAFVVREAAELPQLCVGDPMRLCQILVNLLSNAAKFTERGEVRLEAHYEHGSLRFDVSDTGIGMAPEQQVRLFQAFEQGDGSITRRFGGTGLGLAITKRLLEAMGGTIDVESRESEGTRFRVAIPSRSESPAPAWPRRSVVLVGVPMREAAILQEDLSERGSTVRIVDEADMQADSADLVVMGAESFSRVAPETLARWAGCGTLVAVAVLPGGDESLPGLPCIPISLPLRARQVVDAGAADRSRGAAPARATGRPLAGLRALIVEDNPVNQLVLADILDLAGARTELSNDGQEALDRLKAAGPGTFDIVLTDIQMPIMDGFETTRRIAVLEASLPVVGITAHSLAEELGRCLEAGMVDCIAKPVDASILIDVVAARARRPRVESPRPVDEPRQAGIFEAKLATAAVPSDPVDWAAFETRFANRPVLRERLPITLLRSLDELPEALRSAAAADDFAEIVREAHKIKGMFGTLGLEEVAHLARGCESAAREHDGRVSALARELATVLDEVRDSVGRYLSMQRQVVRVGR